VCEQHKHGSVGAGTGDRPGYPTVERTGGGAPAAGGLPVGDLPEEVREQLTDELIDELLAGRRGEAEILGSGGLLGDLTRRLVERALESELRGLF
jgi:hypothetical protein